MQVCFLGQLCLGVFIGVAGAVFLAVSLLAATKGNKFETYDDIKGFVSSLFYMVVGASWTSRAFDPPHQDSERTTLIYIIGVSVFFVMLGTLYIVKRRLPKEPTA